MTTSSFQELESFSKKYIESWNKHAAVKRANDNHFKSVRPEQMLYPERLQPLTKHPKIRALSLNKIQELLVRTGYKVMGDISAFEIEIITDLCNKLVTKDLSVPIPESSRQVAMLIGIDENYHAFKAKEFILEAEKLTGITPNRSFEEDYPLKRGLNYVRENAPNSFLFESEIVALCLAENFVTEELLGLTKNPDTNSVYYRLTKAHLRDEIRHQAFFQKLLAYLWSSFEEPIKKNIAKILPGFLDNFLLNLEPIHANEGEVLSCIGFTNTEAKQIIKETYPYLEIKSSESYQSSFMKSELPHTKHCIQLLHNAKITSHSDCRKELVKSGWLK